MDFLETKTPNKKSARVALKNQQPTHSTPKKFIVQYTNANSPEVTKIVDRVSQQVVAQLQKTIDSQQNEKAKCQKKKKMIENKSLKVENAALKQQIKALESELKIKKLVQFTRQEDMAQ